jgi:hypothetical protein
VPRTARSLIAFALSLSAAAMPAARADPPLLDFSDAVAVSAFRAINDDVMGGVSSSRPRSVEGGLLFEGEVSLDRNGGFASFRGPVRVPEGAAALVLTVRGDGKRYKLAVKLEDSNAAVQYQAPFTAPGDWTTLRFVPADFSPSFRGRAMPSPPLVLERARTFGLLISDRQAGPFRIELKDLRVD